MSETAAAKKNVWPIFISYRRSESSQRVALELKRRLESSPIEAADGQVFHLDVFVDVAETHQRDFQANLVPHLRHSRALIVLVDDSAATKRNDGSFDYLHSELEWWAAERKRTPPIILQSNPKAGGLLVGNPKLFRWRNVSFMDCPWERWEQSANSGEKELSQITEWLQESIRNYGLVIHLDEVVRLKRRALIAIVFACSAVVLALIALSLKNLAEKQTNIAQTQTTIAKAQTAEALHQGYLRTIRYSSQVISSGDLNQGRKLLLSCPKAYRQWEWWFLMARCGPEPIELGKLSVLNENLFGEFVTDSKSQLSDIAKKGSGEAIRTNLPGQSGEVLNKLVLEYSAHGGRGGTKWEAKRYGSVGNLLVNGYYTGMYGEIPAAMFNSPRCIIWRVVTGEERSTPIMASGELVTRSGDYLASVRDRYIVGSLRQLELQGGEEEFEHDLDTSMWADASYRADEALTVKFDSERSHVVRVFNDNSPDDEHAKEHQIDVDSGTTWRRSMDVANIVHYSPSGETDIKISKQVLDICLQEKRALPVTSAGNYQITIARGPTGPLLLSSWGYGNVRLRDGTSGTVLNESIFRGKKKVPSDPSPNYEIYGGRNTVIPGTNLVAGWVWWKDRVISGIFDLKAERLICEFEGTEGDYTFAYFVDASLVASPTGKEVSFELNGRNEHIFATWSVDTGKLVYGHLGAQSDEAVSANSGDPQDETNEEETDYLGDSHLPSAFAWQSRGEFVAICRAGGVTELRKNFASAPFAYLEGAVSPRNFSVKDIGDPGRVLIGNAVVDTNTWATVLTLPPGSEISEDGDLVAFQTRPGVVDVVHLKMRQASSHPELIKDLELPENILLHQILERGR